MIWTYPPLLSYLHEAISVNLDSLCNCDAALRH